MTVLAGLLTPKTSDYSSSIKFDDEGDLNYPRSSTENSRNNSGETTVVRHLTSPIGQWKFSRSFQFPRERSIRF